MHKDIHATEEQEDTIVEEVVVHLQSNSEQLRSKAKRHQKDEQTSLQHLQESALTWLPQPPNFATTKSLTRKITHNKRWEKSKNNGTNDATNEIGK
uniref:Uncharacterized protein n=1 Tax=Caenorhabditis japonica TaxID=281687 RepID=A0A8R1EI68_CAEJA